MVRKKGLSRFAEQLSSTEGVPGISTISARIDQRRMKNVEDDDDGHDIARRFRRLE